MTLTVSVAEGFRELKGDVEILVGDVRGLHGRASSLETRISDLEKRSSSERVRTVARGVVSDADLTGQAQLADEIVARKALAMKVDGIDQKQDTQLAILARVSKALGNPLLRNTGLVVLRVIQAAGIAWLVSRGLR